MKYPAEVQKRINVLDRYTEVDNMREFNVMHLYPTELAYPNGYYGMMFFDLWLFNTKTLEKQFVGQHDGVMVANTYNVVKEMGIFADGSTIVEFVDMVGVPAMNTQNYMLY